MPRTKHLIPAFLWALTLAGCSQDRPIAGEIDLVGNTFFSAEFDLIDMHGAPATDERFEGKPMLIYFGFTHCPDVCPAALSVMSATLDSLGNSAGKLQPIFITVDPERDTPDIMGEFLGFDERILGLSGPTEAVKAAGEAFKVGAQKDEIEGSAIGYTVSHTSLFYLVDAEGELVRAFRDQVPPDVLAKRLKNFL